jgi:hypothetical protein
MLDVRTYFDKSLELNEGDKMFIPCLDAKHQSSLRTQLNRMRKEYATKRDYKIMELLGVSKQDIDGKLFVVLEKRMQIDDAFILRHDGKTESLQLNLSEEQYEE